MSQPIISFLSDYGRDDEFVAVCKGVMLRVMPDARVLDVTHGVMPGNVQGGALTLARAIPYLPEGVNLAIVDPGVGTDRKAVAIETTDGRRFVGPDNGLLSPAVALSGGTVRAVELDPSRWGMTEPSPTFAGRDVFSPAAAALAGGVDIADLGTPVQASGLMPLILPLTQIKDARAHGVVFWIDRFGNVQTNVTQTDLTELEVEPGATIRFHHNERSERIPLVRTFADVDAGRLLAFIDSAGQLAVGVNGGNAALELEIGEGAPVSVEAAPASLI